MGFQVSPGVEIKEVDLTNVIPAVSTSIGGIVGEFAWGPCDEIVAVSFEKELVSKFGKPDSSNFKSFFSAAGFLRYGSSLLVVRQVSIDAFNADSSGAGNKLIKNSNQFDTSTSLTAKFYAKFPGALGNSIKIVILKADSVDSSLTDYAAQFDSVTNLGSNEVHVLVIDRDGKISGAAGTVLERYTYLDVVNESAKSPAGDGTSAYFKEVINTRSQYIWTTADGNSISDALGSTGIGETLYDLNLSAGDNGSPLDAEERDYSLFEDAETVDVNLLISGECDSAATLAQNLISIAQNRKDVVAFISPPVSLTASTTNSASSVDSVKNFAANLDSSYAVIDSTSLYVYDKYNDVYRWIPASGHIAGLCANTDEVSEPWFSPAGYTRGQLRGVTKIGLNPNQTQRDVLYKNKINPIVAFPGQGIVLFGDKTAQSKPSAFDRINVRRLFIVLEKAIATAAKFQLFELNDEFTRAMFRNMVEPFLRDVQGRRGITDFQVVCDGTNNTGEIIDTNRFVADIYIKPARSINFITLNFIATRTGVEFSEIAGGGA
jgi:phage tail sheath protein FI